MAKVKIAVVIAILALLQVSCATARKHSGGSGGTSAVMTVNGFEKGQDGGGPSECDGKFHSNDDLIVALSSQWYAGGKRCHKKIRITSADTQQTLRHSAIILFPVVVLGAAWRHRSWTSATPATAARTTSWIPLPPSGRSSGSTPTSARSTSPGPMPEFRRHAPSWILDGRVAMRGMEMPTCGCVPLPLVNYYS